MTKIVVCREDTTDDGHVRHRVWQQAVVLADDGPVEVEWFGDDSFRMRVGAEMLSTTPVPEGDPDRDIYNASHVPHDEGPDSASRFKFACDFIIGVLRLLDRLPW